MSKLYIMQGLPASGKSTRAAEIVRDNRNTVRINRDLLRTMLHFDKWTGKNEGITVKANLTLLTHLLRSGLDVVIDDTNLNPKILSGYAEIAKTMGVETEIVRLDTPIWECISRDHNRFNMVGDDVITNMALQYNLCPLPDKVVICDVDGTIADTTHRTHHVQGDVKDWRSFFEGMDRDPVRMDVKETLDQYMKDGCEIIFMSGRPDNYKQKTLDWFLNNSINGWFTLIMRKSSDSRDDVIVKREMFETYIKDKSKVVAVLDDRPKVIRMWRELGLNVIDVGKGIEF